MAIRTPSQYIVWYADQYGVRQYPLDLALISLDYVKRLNGIGWVKVVYGLGDLDLASLEVDYQLQVWRKPPSGNLVLETIGLLNDWSLKYTAGIETIELTGPDINDLLGRRIIAYPAGNAAAIISGVAADDAMKDIFNENFLGGATDTDRDWSGLGLAVAADDTSGSTIEKGMAWRKVIDVLAEIAEGSRRDGDELFFAIEPHGHPDNQQGNDLQFVTYITQPGEDKTTGSGSPIVFSPTWGSLDNATVSVRYSDMATYVYAGGQGEGNLRVIAEVSNTDLVASSIWGRREVFADARNEETTAGVTDRANDELTKRRPLTIFSGDLIDTDYARYGIDWFLGDKVTADVFGQQYHGIIRVVRIRVTEDGGEIIKARLESTGYATG